MFKDKKKHKKEEQQQKPTIVDRNKFTNQKERAEMDAIQKTGKTVDEAVALALGELGITKDEAEIEVIEEGSRGFLGMFGAKDAVVKVKKKI